MAKYVVGEIAGVYTQIAEKTEIEGYTKGVLEILFPDDSELAKWNNKERKEWIDCNNKRMIAICKFLNENNL